MHGKRDAVERAGPDRHAGNPVRGKGVTVAVLEQHGDRFAVAGDVGLNLVTAEPDRAPALARDRAVQLPGDAALALAEHVVDGGGDGGDRTRDRAGRAHALKTAGKFLGDEPGGELP